MPIYQHRIIRLVEAAESFVDFRTQCSNLIHLCNAGRMNAHDALAAISESIAEIDEYAEHVIKDERSRYNITYHRNDIERERMRARRANIKFVRPASESAVSRAARLEAEHLANQIKPAKTKKRKTRYGQPDSGVEPMSQERLDRLNEDTDDTLDFQQFEHKSDAERSLFDRLAEENKRRHGES